MAERLIEAVPNFSEGRDIRIVDEIASAAATVPGVSLLDRTSDADHNRSVLTFAGDPEGILEAAVRTVGAAASRIDLTRQRGVHPRLGACDVLPFVPVAGITLQECAGLAHRAGAEIWNRYRVPVFFYEAAALTPSRRLLEDIRRGEFEGSGLRPDIGDWLHPTAGATVVGARKFLIAYNINLDTPDVTIAKAIARKIRASSGGFPHVKALGLYLASRNQAQVSMNLTDFEITPIHIVFEAVRREAETLGARIYGSELIGLIPQRALEMSRGVDLQWENLTEQSILENRLAAAIRSK